LLLATVVFTSACGGSGESDEAARAETANGSTAAVATSTRQVTQVIVIGADSNSVDAISSALLEFDVGPGLDRVVIVAVSGCDDTGTELVVCRSAAETLEPTTGRQVLIVLDGDFAAAAEVADISGSGLSTIVAGEPSEDVAALAALSSSITFVPVGLSELVGDSAVALFVGIDEALAAFAPVEIGEGVVASRVHRFLDSRLRDLAADSADPQLAGGPVPEPEVRWVLELPDPLSLQGSHERAVVVDNVVAFLGNDEVVRGVDTKDGTVLWTRDMDTDIGAGARSFVSAAGNTILLTASGPGLNPNPGPSDPDRSLWALDIQTGDVLWTIAVPAGGSIGHPATDGDLVFVWVAESAAEISFRALDLADGAEVWRTEGAMGLGPPLVDDGEVWTGSDDGALRGFDAQTGTELIRFDRIGLGLAGVASTPAVTEDRVFFGNDNGTFYAIDRSSGDLVWSFETGSPNLPSSPVIANDLVIFGSFDGGVYALDIDSGDVRWRYDGGETLFLSSAAVADATVYIASLLPPTSLLALDARTGEPIWQLPIGEQTGASPFIDGDTLYIQTPGQFWAVTR